jgi:formylglycine-generating enzyme
MKNKHTILIGLLMIFGIFSMLAYSCKKDNDNNDDDPQDTASITSVVQIPAGTFTMGSPESEVNRSANETLHQVTLSAFKMSKYEITNEQFAAFLNVRKIGVYGAYKNLVLIYPSNGNWDFGLHYTNSKWAPVVGYENHPVINVTWYGASEFASYVGGRLPTEAEWEYACRAATTTTFNTGSCISKTDADYNWNYAYSTCNNADPNSPHTTQAIGTYAPNAYGLYDMHGNVYEWCSDWYGEYSTSAQTNPAGSTSGSQRVLRGGSWADYAWYCRSAFRGAFDPMNYSSTVGFRVVLDQ